ncbi:MAG: nucleotide exchange factor GrpE [Solirubrobacterales bacterium]
MTTAHNGEPEKVEPQDAQPAADPGTPGREAEEVPGGDSAAGGGSEVVDELGELVDGLRRERDEYLGLAQRAKADFENYRKRTAREAADAERRGKLALARDLVPSVDSLERAMAAADEGSDVARGLELVHGELVATLKRAGVESFDPVGERFDPAHSEAVSMQPASGVEAGVVVETLDRGYRSDGTVLRPARVIVAE